MVTIHNNRSTSTINLNEVKYIIWQYVQQLMLCPHPCLNYKRLISRPRPSGSKHMIKISPRWSFCPLIDVISCRRFLFFDVLVRVFLHSTFFPIDVFYFSTFCPNRHFIKVGVFPIRRYVPLAVFFSTFYPRRFFYRRCFFFYSTCCREIIP